MSAETKEAAPAMPEKSRSEPLWKKILYFKIRILPIIVYVPLFALTYGLMLTGKLPKDMLGAIVVMIVFGYLLAEFGARLPIIKNIGGAPIFATFLPSFMVAHELLPKIATDTVTSFMKSTNFLYLYITMVIIGSILGMNRIVLIKGFMKMFVPLFCGTLVAVGVGIGVGQLLGISVYESFFYICVPIMAGGVGEGAIPLSIGYAGILSVAQDQQFARILPVIMLSSLSAIILCGLLSKWAETKPQYNGNGNLVKVKEGAEDILKFLDTAKVQLNLEQMMIGACTALFFYLLGVLTATLIGIPAPIIMLFTAVAIKVSGLLPKDVEDGAHMIHRFFVVGITYPLLMAVGVAMTPWASLVAVFNLPYLITIFLTVLSLITTGFFIGKWMNMYAVETAIVTACHSGQGGTGDVAILTAAKRLVLMPFAQISTRIGGACMVTFAIFLLRFLTMK
jgi:CCS family citrate carrier protein